MTITIIYIRVLRGMAYIVQQETNLLLKSEKNKLLCGLMFFYLTQIYISDRNKNNLNNNINKIETPNGISTAQP